MKSFHRGDRVEYVGPPDDELDAVEPGDMGTLIDEEEAGLWVVEWDRLGAEAQPVEHLHRLTKADEDRPR